MENRKKNTEYSAPVEKLIQDVDESSRLSETGNLIKKVLEAARDRIEPENIGEWNSGNIKTKINEALIEAETKARPRMSKNKIRDAVTMTYLSREDTTKSERKLDIEKLIFPRIKDPKTKSFMAGMWELSIQFSGMIIESKLHDQLAKDIHHGSQSEDDKNEQIGEVLFGHHDWSPLKRKIEAAKWRAGIDIEAMMGTGED